MQGERPGWIFSGQHALTAVWSGSHDERQLRGRGAHSWAQLGLAGSRSPALDAVALRAGVQETVITRAQNRLARDRARCRPVRAPDVRTPDVLGAAGEKGAAGQWGAALRAFSATPSGWGSTEGPTGALRLRSPPPPPRAGTGPIQGGGTEVSKAQEDEPDGEEGRRRVRALMLGKTLCRALWSGLGDTEGTRSVG